MQIGQTKEGAVVVGAIDLIREIQARQVSGEPAWHILYEIRNDLEQTITELQANAEQQQADLPPPPPAPRPRGNPNWQKSAANLQQATEQMQQAASQPPQLRRKNMPGIFDPDLPDDVRDAVQDARKAKQVQRAPPAQVAAPEEDESDEELF